MNMKLLKKKLIEIKGRYESIPVEDILCLIKDYEYLKEIFDSTNDKDLRYRLKARMSLLYESIMEEFNEVKYFYRKKKSKDDKNDGINYTYIDEKEKSKIIEIIDEEGTLVKMLPYRSIVERSKSIEDMRLEFLILGYDKFHSDIMKEEFLSELDDIIMSFIFYNPDDEIS